MCKYCQKILRTLILMLLRLLPELCMGRSKLYMQFKQMTGLTPNEFILKVKLDEACLC